MKNRPCQILGIDELWFDEPQLSEYNMVVICLWASELREGEP